MNANQETRWLELNQRYLTEALSRIRFTLEKVAGRDVSGEVETPVSENLAIPEELRDLAPSGLETLCMVFGLSPFERDLLMLCAGMELDSSFQELCAEIQGQDGHIYPTFSMALASLPGAHWSALSPESPLRYWQLIQRAGSDSLTRDPLRIDERVLHYLTGLDHMDERLRGIIQPLEMAAVLVPSHQTVGEKLAGIWAETAVHDTLPVVQLCGDQDASLRAVGIWASRQVGLNLHQMSAHAIPLDGREMEGLIRLWERESMFSTSALLLECGDLQGNDAQRENALLRWIDVSHSPLILTGRQPRYSQKKPLITLEINKPLPNEQRDLWAAHLESMPEAKDGEVEELIAHFDLSVAGIQAACGESSVLKENRGDSSLWDICRKQTRPRMEGLAQHIRPIARWEDLVLPGAQKEILHEIAAHVRQRSRVYRDWGFADKSNRGLGISAVFAGPSGTGKTMAAEVLANDLRLDLFRIDLSQVISKYIGETEKNLHKIFASAEDGGSILLFDEADALFGKRSEVKDSHDRYANIEISYLLQRMESYRGLAILTTNMVSALDPAFLRRLRFIVHFPFPDRGMRAEIWKGIFPEDTPREALDVEKLSQLNITGGNIRNIALHAAFFAAEEGDAVQMGHLLRAARGEYAKLDKSLTSSEIRGWI